MSATSVAALISVVVAITGGYVYSIHFIVGRIDRRLERIEDRLDRIEQRLTGLEVTVAQIGQRLDDHITDHPGPTERLVGPSR